MASVASDFDFLVATVRRSISQLKTRAAQKTSKEGRGAGLREHIEETLAAIGDRVDTSVARFASAQDDVERKALIDSLRLLNRSSTSMHEATDWLEAVAKPNVHIGILYFVDEAATAIVGVDTDVVPVGDASYQYATISWPFDSIINRLKGTPRSGVRPVVLFFPPQEAPTVMLHSLFAHELAHSAISEHDLVDSVLRQHRETSQFKAEFESVVNSIVSSHGVAARSAQITLSDSLTSWTTEFLCDAIAIEYLGPTYILAFAAVVLSVSWSEPNQTHPPTTLRIRAMLEQLRLRGWEPLLHSAIPETLAWLQRIGNAPQKPTTALERFLVDWTNSFASDINATAADRLGRRAYLPVEFNDVWPEALALLLREILPAQLLNGEPIDRRSILLAGWLHVFKLYTDSPKSIAEGVGNDALQDFLGATMEMSMILDTWKKI